MSEKTGSRKVKKGQGRGLERSGGRTRRASDRGRRLSLSLQKDVERVCAAAGGFVVFCEGLSAIEQS